MADPKQKTVLIVEDEITQSALLEGIVKRAGFTSVCAQSGPEALSLLADFPPNAIDIILLDLVMPGMDGIEVLGHLRAKFPKLPVIMLTAHSSINTVVNAMRAGANDFIVKPASAERIRTAINAGLETASLVGEIELMQDARPISGFDNLIGNSPVINRAIGLAQKAATASIPVFIDGESGVGKEVFARAIHATSDRTGYPFVAVNCGAIPENLVESILFGHEKGAFTGATEKRIGKFEEANGGTLFLDEVGELPQDVQVKLLRAIQEREIDPVGARSSVKVDIRIISATNRNLAELVTKGHFREDLYYRLNVFPINLPPLRERREDIPKLTTHFLKNLAEVEGLPKKSVSQSTINALLSYHWPGNIRQLQNALFRAVILSEQDVLEPNDFSHLGEALASENPAPASHSPHFHHNTTGTVHNDAVMSILNSSGHVRPLADIEADIITAALNRYDGKMAEVARRLNIGRSTLYRKIEEYNLQR